MMTENLRDFRRAFVALSSQMCNCEGNVYSASKELRLAADYLLSEDGTESSPERKNFTFFFPLYSALSTVLRSRASLQHIIIISCISCCYCCCGPLKISLYCNDLHLY